MDLMDLLQGQLSEGLIDQLSQNLGGANKQQTADAASGILSTMVSALAKNASTPEGASSLANALDNDHDGSVLDNVMDMIGGSNTNAQPENSRMMNGAGILKHVLGGKQSGAIDMISKISGLEGNKTGNLMSMLAPLVMGALGRTKREQGLNPTDLAGMLSGSVQSASNKRAEMGLIGKFLDQDGDGSVMDDLANMGMKLFGKFLSK
ncbi:MAG: DUF937 domain-containing protein [Bacteroidota bacterium]